MRELDRLDDRGRRTPVSRGSGRGSRNSLAHRTVARARHGLVIALTVLVTVGGMALFAPTMLPEAVRVWSGIGPQPLGRPPAVSGGGSYAFLAHQRGTPDQPVTYDPCRPIQVAFNPRLAPDGGEEMVRAAMTAIGRATGLRFVWSGHTDRQPQWPAVGDRVQPFGAVTESPVLVSFATEDEVPALEGEVAGVGGSAYTDDGQGWRTYVTGAVTLDSDAFAELSRRRDGAPLARAIAMHEFAHLVGLDHVDDPHELMHPRNTGQLELGNGDRRGLAELGRGRCR